MNYGKYRNKDGEIDMELVKEELRQSFAQIQVMSLKFHELANAFPLVEGKDFKQLTADIKERGIIDRITVFEDKILDGRNRYRAALEAGIKLERENFELFEPRTPEKALEEAKDFVISKNIIRRHLTSDQRAAIAAELYAMLPKPKPGGDQKSEKSKSLNSENDLPSAKEQKQKVAAQMDVSMKKVEQARAVLKADPEKHAEVKAKKKPLSQAEKEVKAGKQAAKAPKQKLPAFDADGVREYITDPQAFESFQKLALEKKIPLGRQAKIAKWLLDQANKHNKGKLTRPFILNYGAVVPEGGWDTDKQELGDVKLTNAEIAHGKAVEQFVRDFGRITRRMVEHRWEIDKLNKEYPGKFSTPPTQEFRHNLDGAIQTTSEMLEQLVQVRNKLPKQ